MEERGPPSSSIHVGDDHPLIPNSRTYIVQVPKDQIYRTPPPENALIAERHAAIANKKPSNGPLRRVLASMIMLVLVLGIICGITLGVIKKDDPRFRVERVRVGRSRQFGVTLASKNPNSHTIIVFDGHGRSAYLCFKDRKFAKGKFPSSEQEPEKSEDVKLTLRSSSRRKLPREIRRSINGTNVEILLEFGVHVTMKIGMLRVKSKTLSMLCHFKVNNLGKNSRVLSQHCDYSTTL